MDRKHDTGERLPAPGRDMRGLIRRAANLRPLPSAALFLVAGGALLACRTVQSPGAAVLRFADDWTYDLSVAEAGEELTVVANLPPAGPAGIELPEAMLPFVTGAEVEASPGHFVPFEPKREHFLSRECARSSCRLRYRVALGEAARALADPDTAIAFGEAIESPPSAWLVRPTRVRPNDRYSFRVRSVPKTGFATGVYRLAGTIDRFGAEGRFLDDAPFTLFGRFRRRSVVVPGATLTVAVTGEGYAMNDDAIVRWIERDALAIAEHFGRFPLSHALVIVTKTAAGGVDGVTLGGGGASIVLRLGEKTSAEAAYADWVLTHELLHLVLPTMDRRQRWLEEGLSTYLEPVVRVRAGALDETRFWKDLVDSLPQGLPASGDLGLDATPTWGRTYWGGALFWFFADVRIRERTNGRSSVTDALRAIHAQGGTVDQRWSVERVLEAGDLGSGTSVLKELYGEMGRRPGTVDLDALWSKLGIVPDANTIRFDEAAPLASLRRAITEPNVRGAVTEPRVRAGQQTTPAPPNRETMQ